MQIQPTKTQLQEAVENIFGEYRPLERHHAETVTEHIITTDMDGNEYLHTVTYEVPLITYGFNWTWATGVLLFTIIMYSFFRCVGGLLKWKV